MRQQQRSHRQGTGKEKHRAASSRQRQQHHLIQFSPVHTLKDEQDLLKNIINVQT